jgi:hypothetical protein
MALTVSSFCGELQGTRQEGDPRVLPVHHHPSLPHSHWTANVFRAGLIHVYASTGMASLTFGLTHTSAARSEHPAPAHHILC